MLSVLRSCLSLACLCALLPLATRADAPVPPLAIADFEAARSPLGGDIERDATVAHSGEASGRIRNIDQRWVTAGIGFTDLAHDWTALRLWVRSEDVGSLSIRTVDATGQSLQRRLQFPADGQWHALEITAFGGGPGVRAWGGVGDAKWHPPARRLELILEAKGTVWVDDIVADQDPARILADFKVRSTALGQVFLVGEPPALEIESKGDQLRWRVTNYWQRETAAGTTPVDPATGSATLAPPAAPGYYLVRVEVLRNGQPLGTHYTSYAVIPPHTRAPLDANPYGVMTHFAQGMETDILPLFDKAGIGSVRDEHYWANVEKTPGVYTFSDSSDAYMADLKTHGIDPLIAMTFANKLHDEGLTPYTDAGRAAYADYGVALLEHYGEQIQALEVWNEYNGTWCKGPAATDRPRYYAEMIKAVYPRIKAVRPDVQVLGTASVLIPLPYIRGIFEHGGLDAMDVVAVHPYRGIPEGVDAEVAELQALIRQFNGGKDKPVWVTETGRMEKTEYPWEAGLGMYEAGREDIARYLVRQYTLLLTRDVARIYWYLCRDHMEFKSMGLLRHADSPMGRYAVAPAYVAYATLIRQLDRPRFVRRVPSEPDLRAYDFTTAAGPVRVCWSTQPRQATFAATGPVLVTDLMGATQTLTPHDGAVSIGLDRNACYIRGPLGDLLPAAAPIAVAGEQRLDLLDTYRIVCTVAPGIPDAALEIDGQRYPLAPGSTTAVQLPARPTDTPRLALEPYRLLVGENVVGTGRVQVEIIDPLQVTLSPVLLDGTLVELHLANTSQRVTYTLTGLSGSVGRQAQSAALAETIAPGELLVLRLPVAAAAPYRATPVALSLSLQGRSPLACAGTAMYSPILKRATVADNNPVDHMDLPAVDFAALGTPWGKAPKAGTVQMAWNDQGLTLAFMRPGLDTSTLQLTVAALDGAHPTTRSIGEDLLQRPGFSKAMVGVEAAFTWADLCFDPAAPPARLRLGLVLRDATGWREWGDDQVMGHNPLDLPVCLLVNAAPKAPATAIAVARTPFAATPAWGPARVLTNSDTDYAKEQGVNNWSYGYYDGDTDGKGDGATPAGPYTDDDFEPMEQVETIWGVNWRSPYDYMVLSDVGGHPGVDEKANLPAWAVRRYVSPVAGELRIQASLTSEDKRSDGVGFRVLLDGRQVYHAIAGGTSPATATCDLLLTVPLGAHLDFAITPGPALNRDYDAARYHIRISALAPSAP